MSGYLARLVATRLGLVEKVQPRLAPLFAEVRDPASARGSGAHAPMPGHSPLARAGSPPRRTPLPSTPGPAPRAVPPALPLASSAAEGTLGVAPPAAGAAPGPLPERALQGTRPSDPAPGSRAAPGDASAATREMRTPRAPRPVLPLEAGRASLRREGGVEEAAAPRSPGTLAPTGAPGGALHPAGRRPPEVASGAPPGPGLFAPGAPAPATATRAPQGPAAAEAEPPVIEVTIGRIEVRAVTPPAPLLRAAPAPRRAPALSLDEYLRRRGEQDR